MRAVVWGIVHGDTDGWISAKVLGAFLGGAVLLAIFVAWEARVPEPMLPLSFYRVRAFTLTNVVSAAMYFGVSVRCSCSPSTSRSCRGARRSRPECAPWPGP